MNQNTGFKPVVKNFAGSGICRPIRIRMATKKKGFITRMIEGPERSDTYARSTMPGNRWELGWGILRDNFGKMFGLNMLMLLFFLPVLFLIFYRYLQIEYYAVTMPFSGNVGLGYPAIPTSAGVSEQIYMMADRSTFLLMPIAGIIASIGLSGGMYVMRNMVWAEGVFVGQDFWKGVKKNFGTVFLSTLLYTLLLLLSVISIDYGRMYLASGSSNWLITASIVMSYVIIAFSTIVYMYSLTFGVTYKLKFFQLIKNSFIMTLGLLPTNLFFAAFALVSVIIMMLGGIMMTIGVMLFLILGLSGASLIWMNYSQWAFDKFINDKVPGAVKNRGIYSKKPEEECDFSFERSTLGKRPIKPITDYDVEIAELPQNFSREDLRKLEESKAAMRKDSDDYVSEMLAKKESGESSADGLTEDKQAKTDLLSQK